MVTLASRRRISYRTGLVEILFSFFNESIYAHERNGYAFRVRILFWSSCRSFQVCRNNDRAKQNGNQQRHTFDAFNTFQEMWDSYELNKHLNMNELLQWVVFFHCSVVYHNSLSLFRPVAFAAWFEPDTLKENHTEDFYRGDPFDHCSEHGWYKRGSSCLWYNIGKSLWFYVLSFYPVLSFYVLNR